MKEKNHYSTTYSVVDYIHRHVRETGLGPTKSEVIENTSVGEEQFEKISKAGYIIKDGSKDDREGRSRPVFNLSEDGAEFLRNSRLNENLDRSIKQEKISSTAETFFTLAILLGAWIQVSISVSSNFSSQTLWVRGISIPTSYILILTISIFFLIIGATAVQLTWEGLKESISENTFWGRIWTPESSDSSSEL